MVELVTRCDAERYELLTNVRLASGAGALVEQIVSALQPHRPTGRSVRHCTPTGLSGIGKSSLAAIYADSYEAIYRIDATSPDSVEDGLEALTVRPGISEGPPSYRGSALFCCMATAPRVTTATAHR